MTDPCGGQRGRPCRDDGPSRCPALTGLGARQGCGFVLGQDGRLADPGACWRQQWHPRGTKTQNPPRRTGRAQVANRDVGVLWLRMPCAVKTAQRGGGRTRNAIRIYPAPDRRSVHAESGSHCCLPPPLSVQALPCFNQLLRVHARQRTSERIRRIRRYASSDHSQRRSARWRR